MRIIDLNKKGWQWFTLFFLAFIWGSSFILMKRGLEVYSHTIVAALRISITFICLVPFALKGIKNVEPKDWKYLIASGLLGNGIPAFLFTKAQTQIPSGISGMLNSLTPIFALLIGLIFFKTKSSLFQVVGLTLGLIGATGLILLNGVDFNNSYFSYSLLIVLATICYAISVNILKHHLKEINSITITSIAFLCIGPFCITYLFSTDFITITIKNKESLIAIMYISMLAIFGTAISVILFNMLIKSTTALFATSVTYLIPIIAILWGTIDGEIFNIFEGICIIIILLGVYFINKFR